MADEWRDRTRALGKQKETMEANMTVCGCIILSLPARPAPAPSNPQGGDPYDSLWFSCSVLACLESLARGYCHVLRKHPAHYVVAVGSLLCPSLHPVAQKELRDQAIRKEKDLVLVRAKLASEQLRLAAAESAVNGMYLRVSVHPRVLAWPALNHEWRPPLWHGSGWYWRRVGGVPAPHSGSRSDPFPLPAPRTAASCSAPLSPFPTDLTKRLADTEERRTELAVDVAKWKARAVKLGSKPHL